MGGKSDGKIEVHEYSMSIHMGICAHGDGIELIALKYGDKEMWRGSAKQATAISINKQNLFGGLKKEGGVMGLAWWLPGDPAQVMPETLAAKVGLKSATCPGYRGLSSVFFTGARSATNIGALVPNGNSLLAIVASLVRNLGSKAGFYWGANNPYLRKLSARIRRAPIGLNPAIALIKVLGTANQPDQYGANPAHIIYECLVNTDWGMGEHPDSIDKGVFESCAQTLYDERFGLSMIWTRQSEVGKFIGEVLDHIQGALFVNPETGKHTLKLLRADYNVEFLPVIDPSNATLSTFKRKVWGEISNEVVVTMTNPESGEEETVAAQDLAGIAVQGAIISSSKNYHGVQAKDLAMRLAERDLASSVNPIATCEATVTREFWDTVSGSVVKLSWPEYDIDQIIFRVSEVSKDDNTVTLSLYEDIFGLDYASYLESSDPGWVNPSQPPEPAAYYQVGTAPAFLMSSAMGLTDPSEFDYPETLASVVVGADSDDDVNFDTVSYVTDVNGTRSQSNLGTRPFAATWVLLSGLMLEAETLLVDLPGLRGAEPMPGDFILIGTGADAFVELATVQSITDDGILLNRGMLDTVPRAWPIGTRAFVLPPTSSMADPTVRSAFEDTSYWFLTRTPIGTLALENAPKVNLTLSERPYRPNRPANVQINGVGFGLVDASEALQLNVTWANRNRILESTQAMKWTEASVAGEAGQTTKITVTTSSGAVLATYAGLTGTSFAIPKTALGGATQALVRVSAERDGYESLQAAALRVTFSPIPYLLLSAEELAKLKLSGMTGYLQLSEG